MNAKSKWNATPAFFLLGILAAAQPASAKTSVAFDNITGHQETGSGVGFGYRPDFGGQTFETAQEFVAHSNGYISALALTASCEAACNFALYTNKDGGPSSLVETLQVKPQASGDLPYSFDRYSSGVALSAGTTYWLVSDTLADGGWNGVTGPSNVSALSYQGNGEQIPTLTSPGVFPGLDLGLKVIVTSASTSAPEIDPAPAFGAFSMLAGVLVVLRGSRRPLRPRC